MTDFLYTYERKTLAEKAHRVSLEKTAPLG
jgi:hypothetical protein